MKRRIPILAATFAMVVVACGTRLPDSAFRSTSPSASQPAPMSEPLRIGNIVSRTNFFDPRAFVGAYYGVKSYVDAVNAGGGINGRRLDLVTCDDQGSATVNVQCVRRLLDAEHVFALVGNAVLSYGGAQIVQQEAVPDIGSQPVDDAYTRYSHLWDVLGESSPRNGRVGWNGVRYNGTEVYRYFKTRYPDVALWAAVVSYNQESSLAFGRAVADGLRVEGYRVVSLQVNFALPDFDAAAVAVKHAGAVYVYDTIDRAGNERLCRALDDNRVPLFAKVTTTQSWDANVRADYADSPSCRNKIFATGTALSYDDSGLAAVGAFRAAMSREGWDKPTTMSEWALEGWAGAQWFADAVRSCGTDVTHTCVESFMRSRTAYDGHGLLIPRTFTVEPRRPATSHSCFNVVRWSDAVNADKGGWVTQVPDMNANCFDVPAVPYRP